MVELTEFITKYGLEVAIIGLVTILFVGIFKMVMKKPLSKIEKSNRKPIYEVMSMLFAYGFTALWLWVRVSLFKMNCDPITWQLWLQEGATVYVAVKVMYPIYENYKIRDLIQLLGRSIVNIFTKKDKAKKVENQSQSKDSDKPITL